MSDDELMYGDDPNSPKYKVGYEYETGKGDVKVFVKVIYFNGYKNGKNYYEVEYYYLIDNKQSGLRRTTLSEEEITEKSLV